MTQMIRFTKTNGDAIWINPEHVIYVEQADRKSAPATDPAPPKKEGTGKLTIVHVSGKEGKVFIKESPEEMNKIFRTVKKELKIEY
jgi:uncharacterized protein YlzI (FlbEa/FlbD family)